MWYRPPVAEHGGLLPHAGHSGAHAGMLLRRPGRPEGEESWTWRRGSPRQQKYFEVGSCSNLGDAQARRLQIRVKGDDGQKYFAHTLNNTVVGSAPYADRLP